VIKNVYIALEVYIHFRIGLLQTTFSVESMDMNELFGIAVTKVDKSVLFCYVNLIVLSIYSK